MANKKTKTKKKLSSKSIRIFYITTPDIQVAEIITQALLKDKLIACSNILPGMISYYWWQGQIEKAQECVLILKTVQKNKALIEGRLKELHPYEVPCLITLPIDQVAKPYGDWLLGSLNP